MGPMNGPTPQAELPAGLVGDAPVEPTPRAQWNSARHDLPDHRVNFYTYRYDKTRLAVDGFVLLSDIILKNRYLSANIK